jgi:hypothetical protein
MSSHSSPTEERVDVANGTVIRTVWHVVPHGRYGEVPVPLAVLGGVVCLVGVGLSRIRPRVRPTAQAPIPTRAENLAE